MPEQIINKVANSKIKIIDLEDFYPKGNRIVLDISQWLFKGLVLKESDFRKGLNKHNWQQYQEFYIALTCSSEAVIPSWAYLLVCTKLQPFAKKVVVGNLELLETVLYQKVIENLNLNDFKNKPVIIKGCSNKPIPMSAYLFLIDKLQPLAKKIMYGEICSAVPLFKKTN